MVDFADLGVLISSGVGSGALTVLGRDLFRLMRARKADRKEENAREDKRLDDCEERFRTQAGLTNALGERMDKVQADVRTILLEKVSESARAMTTAAESQREGNIVIREQTKAIGDLAKETARLVQKLKDNTPIIGTPIPVPGAKS